MIDPMVAEAQRVRAWESKLEAEIRADYFADLAGALRSRQRLATWTTLFCSSGALISALAKLPADMSWLSIVLPLGAAAASLYAVVAQNHDAAVAASDLHFKWQRLFLEARELWEDIESGTVSDAATRLAHLDDKAADLSKSATAWRYSRFEQKRMLKWYDVVLQQRRLQDPTKLAVARNG